MLEPCFQVTTAESNEQALSLLRRRKVDVVTLHSMIPGRGGIELVGKIREIDPVAQIVVVTGSSLDDPTHALRHTASAGTLKPIDAGWLIETVERAAKKGRRHRERAARAAALGDAGVSLPEVRDERKRDAVRMISHDIKNRLGAILGFVRLLREGELDAWHTAEAIDVIEGKAHEAATLTVNFLHAEESDDGALQLHKARVSLNEIAGQVLKDEGPRARLKRIELQADLDPALPSVDLDGALISRSVTNLLDNALHYSPEGGVVRIETRRLADDIILRVRDHGPGIPTDEVPRLFERYGRGAASASGVSTGLGLYLVRTIVEAHGGSISATFPPDGGTAFVIVLPCPPPGDA